MSLGMNDTMPCGTDAARKRHRAKAQLCLACEPDVERSVRCSACRNRVVVIGEAVQPHPVRFGGNVIRCVGSGGRVPLPAPMERPIFVAPRSGMRRVVALPAGAA